MNRSSNLLSNNARNISFFDYFFWGGGRGLSYKPPRTKYISTAMKPSPWGPVREWRKKAKNETLQQNNDSDERSKQIGLKFWYKGYIGTCHTLINVVAKCPGKSKPEFGVYVCKITVNAFA